MHTNGNIAQNYNLQRGSNICAINKKGPVSATANSRIKLSTGEFDIQETIISTEVTASNPSVAAARATAKAASIATSTLTSDNRYFSQNDLKNNFTFQISTFCTIEQVKPDPFEKYKGNEHDQQQLHALTSENIRQANKNVSSFQKGTKFERLRRELEDLGQNESYLKDFINDYHISSPNKSGRLSTFSTLSNMSTSSSIKSEPVTYHSILSEPVTYSSDNTNRVSYENMKNKSNMQRNAFLTSDLDSSESNSNSRKIKISDLKRSDKINNTETRLRDLKGGVSNNRREVTSLYCMQTVPGSTFGKSFTLNRDAETLFSNSSSMMETDLDSGTLSTSNLFPQTDFCGNQPLYSFEKTRSMVDIRKDTDISYNENVTRALSSENLKKTKPTEEISLITRLKSKAQSTQELRIADSLTKLNVPEWMKDFKMKDRNVAVSKPVERKSLISLNESSTLRYKDVKRHDSILSKYKYDSLPAPKTKRAEQSSQVTQVKLPSSLYRSKSQNLIYYNPKENSKLKGAMENLNSSLKSLNSTSETILKIPEPISDCISENLVKRMDTKSLENKIEHQLKYPSHEKKIESPIKIIESNIQERKMNNLELKPPKNIDEVSSVYSELNSVDKHRKSKNVNLESKSSERKSEISYKNIEKVKVNESNSTENNNNNVEETSVKRVILSKHDFKDEVNFKNFEEKDNIIMQSKKESQFFLQKIIDSALNSLIVIDDVCEAFRINPTTLKLLLNVKRKTPNLNRDETFVNMKLNESSYIENSLRKGDNNKYVIFCDVKTCKNELFQSNKISRTTCSCYNCYMYYCSKKCRNMGFTQHFHACSFKRIREMMPKIKNSFNSQQINALSKYASESYQSFGRGMIIVAFESCRSADDFLNRQPNRLMSQPYYLKLSETMDSDTANGFVDYIPETEFLICLIISATLPMTSVEVSYPTFKYCYQVKYPAEFIILTKKKIEIVDISKTSIIAKEMKKENSNVKVKFDAVVKISEEKTELESRKEFFNYVIEFFKKKHVNIMENYSSIYRKLERFVSEGIAFEPLTVYIKDPLINSTVSCTIFPNRDITLKPVRTIMKSIKSADPEPKQNGNKCLEETEI